MLEIEHKYLTERTLIPFNECIDVHEIYQGYIVNSIEQTIRCRVSNDSAFITIKGGTKGASRIELEEPVSVKFAQDALRMFGGSIIHKTRYDIIHDGMVWEVDVFHGDNDGLVLAEIELNTEDQPYTLPNWVREEVTYDPKYTNARIAIKPFSSW